VEPESNLMKSELFILRMQLFAAAACYGFAQWLSLRFFSFTDFVLPFSIVSFFILVVFSATFFLAKESRAFSEIILSSLYFLVTVHLTGLSAVNHFPVETLVVLLLLIVFSNLRMKERKFLIGFNAVLSIIVSAIISNTVSSGNSEAVFIKPLYFYADVMAAIVLSVLYGLYRIYPKKVSQIQDKEEPVFPSMLNDIPDAYFLIDGTTGTTIDLNDAAVKIFEAKDKAALIGLDISSLLKDNWTLEQKKKIRESLNARNEFEEVFDFVTGAGKIFSADFYSKKIARRGDKYILVRITPAVPATVVKTLPEPAESPYKKIMEEGHFCFATINGEGKLISFNNSFSKITGYADEELLSLSYYDLIHPDDLEREQKNLATLFSSEIPFLRKEKRLLNKLGQSVWVHSITTLFKSASGAFPYAVTLIENITQRKRTEKALYENKDNLSLVIESSDAAVFSLDRNYNIIIANNIFSNHVFAQTGISIAAGYNLKNILPEKYRLMLEDLQQRALSGEYVRTDYHVTEGKDDTVYLEISSSPVKTESETVRGVVYFISDISKRKAAERDLIIAKEAAETAASAKTSFLAMMSHEIRNPLNGVIGMAELLNNTTLSKKQREYLDSILLSGETLLSVINDILDFSKIESAKMELEFKPVELKRSIEETFDLLSPKASEKNLRLEYFISPEVPYYIMGDSTRLRQILLNLVSNAVKFTPRGKISVSVVKTSHIADKIELQFAVKDTGIGIASDKIDKLFQSFYQAGSETTRQYGGTGLGLAICKNLVTMMGGRIRAESLQGSGSTFYFTIQTAKAKAPETTANQKQGASMLINSRVLVISDNAAEAGNFSSYFHKWGMHPQITDSFSEALNWLRNNEHFDLISIDAKITQINFMELVTKIRTLFSPAQLPLIIFNASGDDIYFNYSDKTISAIIPQHIDRSRLLDILISVFTIEEHHKTRHQYDLKQSDKELANKIPLNILIAEDNKINQKLAVNIIESLGYHPDTVENGLEVISNVKKKKYDMIFMDIQMPELDGYETTRHLHRTFDSSQRPVIIAMTAFAMEGDKEKCIAAGMDDYISKPIIIDEIINVITRYGGNRKSVQIEKPVQVQEESDDFVNRGVIQRLKELNEKVDPDFFKVVINMFLNQSPNLIDEIKHYMESGQYDKMGQAAHKLKGSSMNLGASSLAELCKKIEIKARTNELSDIDRLIESLQPVYEKTETELKKLYA